MNCANFSQHFTQWLTMENHKIIIQNFALRYIKNERILRTPEMMTAQNGNVLSWGFLYSLINTCLSHLQTRLGHLDAAV